MSTATRIVGLDVGGTQVKGGYLERSELDRPDPDLLRGRLRAIDTDLSQGIGAFVDQLAAFARALGYDGALGVGVPGVFHSGSGELQRSANMKGIQGVRLAAELRARLGEGRIVVDNDANAAAFGEQWLGAGANTRDLILITLGTGVGGGVVLDGEIFRGPT
ncbi:MAG: ROK family protein, partial [Planctomycetota bacterium]|nr:ROK family protein [Planctomycetota bacterium]